MHATRALLLLVDVEPDARKPAPGQRDGWAGTRIALALLAELRDQIAARTRARATVSWFLRLDPQIEGTWGRPDRVREAVPALLTTIARHADHVGIHPHLWRWSGHEGCWYTDLADERWMRHCLDTSVEAYRSAFGSPPEACRFGDRFLSDGAVRAMRERGLRYDLTLEPGLRAERPSDDRLATGASPDYRSAPRAPYRPSRTSYLQPAGAEGESGPWMIPLSTSPPRWHATWAPPAVRKASLSPNLCATPVFLAPHLDAELSRDTATPLVLAMRSGDLASARRRAQFRGNVRRLLAHPGLARCEAVDPPTAIDRWLASGSQ